VAQSVHIAWLSRAQNPPQHRFKFTEDSTALTKLPQVIPRRSQLQEQLSY